MTIGVERWELSCIWGSVYGDKLVNYSVLTQSVEDCVNSAVNASID